MAPILLLALGLSVAVALAITAGLRRRARARADAFAQVLPLFDETRTRIEPTGFPRVTARQASHRFDLQLVPDALTFRKLPALWLMVTLPEPLPVRGTLDIMMRPTGHEPFSRFSHLPVSVAAPPFLPEGSGVRSDSIAVPVPERLIAGNAHVFADPRVKELVISPKGIRIVALVEGAGRGRFLLFRDAEVGLTPVAPGRVLPLCDAILALREDIVAAELLPA